MRRLRRSLVPPQFAGVVLLLLAGADVPFGASGGRQVPAATPAATPQTVEAQVAEGMRLARERKFPEAEPLLLSALERATAEGNALARGNALWALGSIRGALGDPGGQRRFDEQAEAALSASGDAGALGQFFSSRGFEASVKADWAEAEKRWTAALAAFDRAGDRLRQAQILRNLTFLPSLDAGAKLARLDEALAVLPPGAPPQIEGAIHHQIGDVLFLLGDTTGALAEVELALPLLDGPTTRGDYARAIVSLARLYRTQGDPAQARAQSERAAVILAAAGDQSGAAQALVASALASNDLGLLAQSLSTLGRAVETARVGTYRGTLAHTLGQRAAVLVTAGQPAEASRLVAEALDMSDAPGSRSQLLSIRASAQLAAGDTAQALTSIDEAIASQDTLAIDLKFQQHSLRAQILARLDRPGEAVVSSGRAVELLERLRSRAVPDDFYKRSFNERVRANYALHVRLLVSLGRTREALEAAERARARAFLDLLATRDLRRRDSDVAAATAPPAEHTPPTGSAQAGSAPPSQSPGLVPAAGHLGLKGSGPVVPSRGGREVVVQRATALRALESRVTAEPPNADDVAQVASRLSSTVVSYWVDEQRTWAWIVSPGGAMTFRELPVGERELTRRVRQAWALPDGRPANADPPGRTVTSTGPDAPQSAGVPVRGGGQEPWEPLKPGAGRLVVESRSRRPARELYDLLIAPLRSALPRTPGALITFVAHGPLHRLSFAGLAAPSGRYLVEDFRIHYAPSIGLLRTEAPGQSTGEASHVLVVADPRLAPGLARSTGLTPLPGALAEGRSISRAVGSASVVSLVGRAATESRVRQEAGDARVLHFATHGVVSDDRPFDSFLALAGSRPGDSRDDGRLTVAEVYDLSLAAEMVVLSACRSASGPVTGDGVMGLTRAFIYAGADSVVASLWNLPDEAARFTVTRFYRAWHQTGDKADALRTAQLQLLHALRAGRVSVDTPAGRLTLPEHPAIWAGLVLSGRL